MRKEHVAPEACTLRFGALLDRTVYCACYRIQVKRFYVSRLQRLAITCWIISLPACILVILTWPLAHNALVLTQQNLGQIADAVFCVATFDAHVSLFPSLAETPYDFCWSAKYYMGTLW